MGERPHRGLEPRTAAYAAIGFALLWNLISLPAAFFVPGEIADGNTLAARRPAVPAHRHRARGVGDSRVVQLKRFKVATSGAATRARRARRATQGHDPRRRGSARSRPTSGSSSMLRRATHARQRQEPQHRTSTCYGRSNGACRATTARSARRSRRFPSTSPCPRISRRRRCNDGDGKIIWRLEVTGECPGPDFWSRFELPVFDVGEQRADRRASRRAAAPDATHERPDRASSRRSASSTSALPQGGEAWTFRRGQHKSVAPRRSRCSRGLHGPRFPRCCSLTDAPLLFPIVFSAVRRAVRLVGAVALVHGVPRDARPRRAHARAPRLHGARADRDSAAWSATSAHEARHAGRQQALLRPRVETGEGTHTAASSLGRLRRRELARAALDERRPAARSDVARRIGDAGRPRSLRRRNRHESQRPHARPSRVGLIARHRQREIHAELERRAARCRPSTSARAARR